MIHIISVVFLSVGLYMVIADVLRLPYMETSRAVVNLSRNQAAATRSIDVWLGGIAKWLAKHIRINSFKRQSLEEDLQTAQIDLTPEEFRANAIIKALLLAVLAPLCYWMSPFMSMVCLVMSIWLYRRENTKLAAKIREKRNRIEYELPWLVGIMEKNLKRSRDVLQILQSYEKSAGPELRHELTITLADMRSGNYQQAISRMAARVGSPLMSDVCRGLIAVINGDDTMVYWATLQAKFSSHQQQELRKQAQRVPPKCRRLSLYMLLCMIAIYMVVIVTYLMETLGTIFG